MAATMSGNSTGPAGGDGGSGESKCVAAVRAFYSAINSGDGGALAALLAEDVEWDAFPHPTSAQKADVPWLRAAHGRAAVLHNHGIVLSQLDGEALASARFEPKQIVAQGDTVFTTSDTLIASKVTGKAARMQGAYLFQFNQDGLIKVFKHFVDTGAHVWVATADEDAAAAWAAMGRGGDAAGKQTEQNGPAGANGSA